MHPESPLPQCAGCALSRRDFLAGSVMAAVAAVLTASCGDGQIGAAGPTGPTTGAAGLTIRVADFPALANVGGIARVDGGKGSPVAVVRTGAGSFSAFSLVCPHQGTTINITANGFKCPNHGATFASSGSWIGGQPTSSLTALALTYDAAAGTITIGGTGGGTPQQPGPTPNPGNVSLLVRLADFPALAAVGGVARVDGGSGTPVGVGHVGASQYVAYTLACTHQGTTVNASGSGWLCPNHGARFSSSGAVTQGPATAPLAPLTVTLDQAAGTLTITGAAPTTPPGSGDDDGGDDGDG